MAEWHCLECGQTFDQEVVYHLPAEGYIRHHHPFLLADPGCTGQVVKQEIETMNREIKFRVWNKETKRMSCYDNDCTVPDMTLSGVLLSHSDQSNVSYKYILEQFTGLKDKHGKEIYEGDKVKVLEKSINPDQSIIWKYYKDKSGNDDEVIVYFDTNEFRYRVRCRDNFHPVLLSEEWGRRFEVIGTEQPEQENNVCGPRRGG